MVHRKEKTTTDEGRIRESCRIAYRVQLYIQFFNQFNCWFLHALKMICISAAILHGYVGVRFGHKNPLIAIFCFAIHIAASVVYFGVFQSANGPVELQKVVKRDLLAASVRSSAYPLARKELLKITQALRCQGIKVGSFHEIERNSVLIFVDFVERQLMSLLVAF